MAGVMRAMLSQVPAMSTRMGWLWYRHWHSSVTSRQSGLSSYILISWAMMPCSLATVSSVK